MTMCTCTESSTQSFTFSEPLGVSCKQSCDAILKITKPVAAWKKKFALFTFQEKKKNMAILEDKALLVSSPWSCLYSR